MEAGQYPMAYVVRKAGSSISEKQVMDFVAGQVCFKHFSTIYIDTLLLLDASFRSLHGFVIVTVYCIHDISKV